MNDNFGSFLQTVGGNEGIKCKYPTRLDTYGCGCSHDCSYCYAKSLLSFRKMWNPDKPKVASAFDIASALKKVPRTTVLRLGGMTDCFQPIEKLKRSTYNTLYMLNKRRQPYLIVTKSDMVADPEYMERLDKDLAHIQITITTTDDDLSLTYEKATVPSNRIKAIARLFSAGFDVQVRLSPYIEQNVDITQINDIPCDKIIVEFLRVNHWIKKWFDLDYSKWTHTENGYQHLPLEEKVRMLEKIHFKEISVCEDCTDHYAYWRDHVNHNPDDCCNLRISGE